jgi:hypothetical protein
MIVSCDELTRGVQAKARPEFSTHTKVRGKLPRHAKLYRDSRLHRGYRNNDFTKILSVVLLGRRLDYRGPREYFLGESRGRQAGTRD